jgi:hypothetical protein
VRSAYTRGSIVQEIYNVRGKSGRPHVIYKWKNRHLPTYTQFIPKNHTNTYLPVRNLYQKNADRHLSIYTQFIPQKNADRKIKFWLQAIYAKRKQAIPFISQLPPVIASLLVAFLWECLLFGCFACFKDCQLVMSLRNITYAFKVRVFVWFLIEVQSGEKQKYRMRQKIPARQAP